MVNKIKYIYVILTPEQKLLSTGVEKK